jgi:hypothetical protein
VSVRSVALVSLSSPVLVLPLCPLRMLTELFLLTVAN